MRCLRQNANDGDMVLGSCYTNRQKTGNYDIYIYVYYTLYEYEYVYIYICIISTQNWEYGTTTEDELPIGSCGYDETLNEAAGVEIRHENHIGFGGLD